MSVKTAFEELIVHAPAKLNLFLKIQAKRPDGFHDIDTVMQAVDLQDTLRIRSLPTDQLCLRLSSDWRDAKNQGDQIPEDGNNLVLKAAHLLRQRTDTNFGAEIFLMKRIPSQAGLGGGSADAGATLRGLNELWQLGLSLAELAELAAELGSDIPFFAADCRLARCLGRGEQLSSEHSTPLHFVVVKPGSGLSTAQVYSRCSVSKFSGSGSEVLSALKAGQFAQIQKLMKNGLEEAARGLNPEVDAILELMSRQPFVGSMLSGSGSACFGLCYSRRQALQLSNRLRGMTDARIFVVRSRV